MLGPIDRTTERALVDRIDRGNLDEHLDALEGLERHSGTADEWTASEYVVGALEAAGAEADLLEFEGYVSRPGAARIDVTTPTPRTLEDVITTAFGASTPAGGVHGEVVDATGLDLTAQPAGALDGAIPFVTGFPQPERVRGAERAGAAALVVESITPGQLHEWIVTPVWGTPGLDDVGEIPRLPVVQLHQADGEWLRGRLEAGPVEATVTTEVTTELADLPCPVGRVEGTDSDRYMVIGNHVDSWYEGMTDNATAVAATIELARVLAEAPMRRGFVFGFWPAHSFGRFAGSAWYADEHWLDLRENAVCYLHLDLNGLRGADSLWYQHMAELEAEHVDALEAATGRSVATDDDGVEDVLFEGSDRPGRSADQSFWGTGCSSLFSGLRLPVGTEEGGPVGAGWWWHTRADTRDKVDVDVLAEELRIYLSLAARVCASPVLPHDFRRTAEEIGATAAAIEEAAPVEFDDVRAAAEALGAALETAYGLIEARAADEPALAAAAEDLQVRLGNRLVPALYTARSPYEHEPATSHDLLPGLRVAEALGERSGRERRFAETDLRRARTRLCHQLDRARTAAEAFNRAHED